MSTGNEWTQGMREIIGDKIDMKPKLSRNGKRLWSKAQKRLIVNEAMKSGMSVSKVSREYDINANLIFRWIKKAGIDVEKKQQLIPVGVISASSVMKRKQESSALLSSNLSPSAPPMPSLGVSSSGAPKIIEVDLRGGTRIKIDGEIKGAALQQVLKLIRSLA